MLNTGYKKKKKKIVEEAKLFIRKQKKLFNAVGAVLCSGDHWN